MGKRKRRVEGVFNEAETMRGGREGGRVTGEQKATERRNTYTNVNICKHQPCSLKLLRIFGIRSHLCNTLQLVAGFGDFLAHHVRLCHTWVLKKAGGGGECVSDNVRARERKSARQKRKEPKTAQNRSLQQEKNNGKKPKKTEKQKRVLPKRAGT